MADTTVNPFIFALALCLGLLAFGSGPALAAERVIAVSDSRMPYNGTPGSKREGYAVEILRAVFEPRGIEVEYRELPWKRAVQDVRSGQADILIGVEPFEMPDMVFPKHSLGRSDLCFFSSSPDWRFTGPDSLKGVVTGYIQGHAYPQWFLDDIRAHPDRFHALHGGDAFDRMLAMLAEGRVQVIPGSTAVATYYVRKAGLDGQVFAAGCSEADSRELYFALSPANMPRSRLLADVLDKGVDTLRNTGQLNFLLIKYGLKDWVKIR